MSAPVMDPIQKATYGVELDHLRRRIWFLSGELEAVVELLEIDESPDLEDREDRLLRELRQACARREILRKVLGIKVKRRWTPKIFR